MLILYWHALKYGVQFLIANMAHTALETFTHASVIHLAVTSSCA